MSSRDRVNEPVSITVTFGESMQLMGALVQMLRSRRERYGADDPVVLDARRLLWKLEEAAADHGEVSSHSQDALAPEGTPPNVMQLAAGGTERWDEHNFTVERQLPDGTWTTGWSSATPASLRWRAMCQCGWRGQDISGNQATGREDDDSREDAYEVWDREHVPDYVRRHNGG